MECHADSFYREVHTLKINTVGLSSSDLWQLLQAAQGGQTSAVSSSTQSSSTASASSSGDSASVSDPAKLIKELEQLGKTNPAEFRKLTASVAEQLKAAARNSTDSGQAQALNTLSSEFTQASQTGNLNVFFSQHGGSSGSQTATTPSAENTYSNSSTNPIEEIFSQALQQISVASSGT